MPQETQPRQTAKPDDTIPIPSIDEIYKQRTAIDALALEISNEEKLFNEANAEKKKQLRELKVALANSIRQTNLALQQLAVPVTVEVQPAPEPLVDSITITNIESPSIQSPAPVSIIPEPVPIIPSPQAATPNYKPFYIIIGILILLVLVFAQCHNRPNPNPDPSPNPNPSPIVITKADEIIKAVNAESLTYNEKIVEATRRLTMEVGLEREAAYQYATEKITKGTDEATSDSVSIFPLSDDGVMQNFRAITQPNLGNRLDYLVPDRGKWRAHVKTVMNLRMP